MCQKWDSNPRPHSWTRTPALHKLDRIFSRIYCVDQCAMASSSTELTSALLDSGEVSCKRIRLDAASDVSSSTDTPVGCHQTPTQSVVTTSNDSYQANTSGDSLVRCGDTTEDRTNVSTSGVVSDNSTQEDQVLEKEDRVLEEGRVLCEQDVGIIEYISSHPGFSGIIKQRYSDFLVNEIDLAGEVVRLTDLSCPVEATSDTKTQPSADTSDVFTDMQKRDLDELQESKNGDGRVLLEAGVEKERRSQIHNAIKSAYPQLNGQTLEKDGKKYIEVKYEHADDHRSRNRWPKERGDYCRFVLYKENKDTSEVVNLIAKFLRMKASCVTYAGTKDRRAKTCQQMALHRVTAKRLYDLNRTLRNIKLGNFSYSKNPLKLGDLGGNHFTIILRNVTGTDTQIEQAATSLQSTGFINYFGMQRFGTTSVPTHDVGRAMLQSKWQKAIELILKPRGGDKNEVFEARQTWWDTRDAGKALECLGNRPSLERHLLLGLKKYNENDLVNALAMIPRNMRQLYLHAYQSRLWNILVSRRIREFGMKPIVGDLVLGGPKNNAGSGDVSQPNKPTVLTSDDIINYTIEDVVMPLPGYDVVYPASEVGAWYQDLLQQDGFANSSALQHKIRDYQLPGGYRTLIIKPRDMSWQPYRYDDVTVPLVLSDAEQLDGAELAPEVKEGKFRALKLEFSLPPSSYATMAIREVLKCDTSAAHQTSLNVI
ncbi:TRUD domain-containing protein [Lamellibrachia satsuma]|nr:TRUD domain-containing protein [Lamellibrachia satsuma]